MDLRKQMVIIDNKIVTTKLAYCIYNKQRRVYNVKYKGSSNYLSYSLSRVLLLENPTRLNPLDYEIILNDKKIRNIKELYEFSTYNKKYYYLINEYNTGYSYAEDELKINRALDKNIYTKSIYSYLKDIADKISLKSEDGSNLLLKQYDKIRFNDSVLKYYLNPEQIKINKIIDNDALIFPFGCNASQYNAIYNAIHNKISVVEGPPGTGKTQTILNIIANIIIRNKTCEVVSNNNSAIENIEEKLKKYDLDFFVALLGNKDNKETFILNQKLIPDFSKYNNYNLDELRLNIDSISKYVNDYYIAQIKIAKIKQELSNITLEYKYFKTYIKENNINIINLNRYNPFKLNDLWSELSITDNITFINKLKYIFIYRIGNFKFYKNDKENIIYTLNNLIYKSKIENLNNTIKEYEQIIDNNKNYEERFKQLSLIYFKKYISERFKTRNTYSSVKDKSFLKDYPIILSTTYSSKSNIDNDITFDYVIMDEASQIDVVTGALALSCANNAVIIGDDKQLPNVVPNDLKIIVDNIFNRYNLNKGYSFSDNSFLDSIKSIINNVPIILLREHYRCHPKIIEFCNKKFYNNELVIMTNDNNEKNVIQIIKTNEGNHSREKTNERQIDIIKELLEKNNYDDVGIIAPYNNQVNSIRKTIPNIEVNTIHKYQGREKDTIIISTVDDKISEFVDNPNILNVAISRAKKNLIMIVTGNDTNNTNINDFIEYVKYNNFEIDESKIYSIFDYLYKQYTNRRIEYLKNYRNVSKYDSENLMYSLIQEEIKNRNNLDVIIHHRLRDLIKDKSELTEEEKKYVLNYNTHLDFLIYNTISKKPVLAIEVDGYEYHKEGTKQHERDILKDKILDKYNIQYIRFKTTGSEEKKRLHEKINNILLK